MGSCFSDARGGQQAVAGTGQKKVLIDLKSKDDEQRAKARGIATDEATGLKYAGFNKEHGDLLVVIAEKIDASTVVGKIRKAGMRDAELKGVKIQN